MKYSLLLMCILTLFFLTLFTLHCPAYAQDSDPTLRLKELEAKEASLSKGLDAPAVNTAAAAGKAKKAPPEVNPLEKPLQEAQRTAKSLQDENKALQQKYSSLEKDYHDLEGRCAGSEASVSQLQQRAQTAEETARKLARDLDETRGKLMVAETEVERYSVRYGGRPPIASGANAAQAPAAPNRADVPVDLRSMPGAASQDMSLATVTAPSAALRTGPGPQYSTLMNVDQGTSLPIEGRQGEWLKVITPMGARAFIHGSACRLGRQAGAPAQPQPAAATEQFVPVPKVGKLSDSEEAAFNSLNSALKAAEKTPGS